MEATLWTCPYCNRPCTLQDTDVRHCQDHEYLSKEHGSVLANFQFTICPNPKCRQQTIVAHVFNYDPSTRETAGLLHEWRLVPESEAKPFPDFIPVQLLDDYREACLIRNKSPKASATLSRRCLQGMIRDFWGIAKGRLIDEVNALQSRVDAQTWKAIDAVRKVGNIGAHMEKDVNLIVDVEPEEASLLI
jgi:hypothetical protein